jgi:CHAD domain-containing protein
VSDVFPTEREVKLVPASAGALLRLRPLAVRLGAKLGPPRLGVLRDVYLDSSDHWLWRAGFGMRIRDRDGNVTLTVKAARGGGVSSVLERPEIEENIPRIPPRFPCPVPGSRIARWLRQVAGPLQLHPVARITLRRCESDATLPGGLHACLCADAVLAVAGGHCVRFWEVEIESSGPTGDLERFAKRLSELAGWRIVTTSKLERALELADVPPPGLDEQDLDIRPEDSCAAAARRVVRRHWGRYVWNEPGSRAGLDPEALHDMRVAARRLRAAWPIFQPCLPCDAKRWFADLRWISGCMGRVRDLDVEIESLRATGRAIHPRHWPAVQDMVARLEHDREGARRRLLRALETQRHRAMARGFDRLTAPGLDRVDGPFTLHPADRIAAEVIRDRARKVFRSLRRVRPDSPDEDLHALRIQIKKLRYAIEFFGPILGKQARKVAGRLAAVQDLLGAHQDASVMCGLLARMVARSPANQAIPAAAQALTAHYGRVHQEQRAALPDAMSGSLCHRIERLTLRRM